MAVTGSSSEEINCLACPSCDLVFDVSKLGEGESARCTRCGHFLTVYREDALYRVMAFTSSALILMVLACSFPFMTFKASGLESVMTLPETALKLWVYDMPCLSLLVTAFIIIIPTLMLFLNLFLVSALLLNRNYSWLPRVGRLVYTLESWSMVEVFFIGVLVSLVKIAKMATIVMGISFWAYGAFSILFILAMSGLDRVQCWQRIEALSLSKLDLYSLGLEKAGSDE
jgi:paraquat-inducible protein A